MNSARNCPPHRPNLTGRLFRSRRGSTLVEYALTGIPLIFAQIGVAWLALSMWQSHSLQSAAEATTAYVSAHGAEYVSSTGTAVQIRDIAAVFAAKVPHLPPAAITLTFTAGTGVRRACRLDHCKTDTTAWPPSTDNAVGTDVAVHATLDTRIPLAMISIGGSSARQSGAAEPPGNSHRQIVY